MRAAPFFGGATALCALAAVIVACTPRPSAQAGHTLYEDYCAACHGPGGQDGAHPDAPDLTRLSARNDGEFPTGLLLARLEGYGQGLHEIAASDMPRYALLMDGRLTRIDLPDGRHTQVPVKVVAINRYLESIQR